MRTHCNQESLQFHSLGGREVRGRFDGGAITSDAGGLLLREMENRIKEQLSLFADRTSTALLRSNQVRLYFSSVAYLLMEALRRLGLAGTEWARAQCDTLRWKLLKIGAQIRVTVRRVWISLAGGYPYAELFVQVYAQLRALPLRC